ncbi:hypothetical protein ACS0TY_019927 [Phlomoides rotata]
MLPTSRTEASRPILVGTVANPVVVVAAYPMGIAIVAVDNRAAAVVVIIPVVNVRRMLFARFVISGMASGYL